VLDHVLGAVFSGALFCAAACWSTPVQHIPDSASVYDVPPPEPSLRFDAARRSQEAGHLDVARPILAELAREYPENLYVGIWLQELEVAAVLEGAEPATPSAAPAPPARSAPAKAAGSLRDPRLDALRQRYRQEAEARPSVARWVLAARLESDDLAANLLLDRAQALDPRCAWTHYAKAWIAAGASRWPEVKAEIAAAKEADPGHMPTRWLDAWMLARGGGVREAISALQGWIEKADGDLRLDPRRVREAQVDLALLSVLDADPKRAREILEGLGDGEVDPGRKWAAVAPTEQALDDEHEALAAAIRAEHAAPGEILPVVQQAILYESWLDDPGAAEAAWTRALALARGSSDLGALLERVRARVHVERLRAEREKKSAPSSN
jgi:predicted Zn-dependent protease